MNKIRLPRLRNVPIYAKAFLIAGILLLGSNFRSNAQVTYDNGDMQPLMICQDATATATDALLTASDLSGTTFKWTIITGPSKGTLTGFPATATAGTSIAPSGTTYTPNGGYNGLDTFSVQVDDGAGNFDTIMINVTVNPTPDVTIPMNQTVCNGDTTTTVSFSGSVSGTKFAWANDNNSIGLASSDTGDIHSFTTTNSTTVPVIANIMVTPIANGCIGSTQSFAINVNPTPAAIGGISSLCQGDTTTLTDATLTGNWSSSNTSVATIDPTTGFVTSITAGTSIVTYQLGTGCSMEILMTINAIPNAISGSTSVCESGVTTLSDDGGGTWSSADGTVAVNATTGDVSGITAGTATVTYTLSGCMTNTIITVNPAAGAISGATSVCAGSTITLSDAGSGNWGSSDATVSVNATTGDVQGISAGTAMITYMLPTTCAAATTVTINPLPAPITGSASLCFGLVTNFTDDTTGGTWSTSDATVASIISTGDVTGVNLGTATITYTLPTSCAASMAVTVNPTPAAISGKTNICMYDNSVSLSDADGGGSWTAGGTVLGALAIDNSTGNITPVASGTATITYTLPAGCSATTVVTVLPAPAGQTVNTGGNYCINSAGSDISIAGSDTGFNYQLLDSSLPVGSILGGTTGPLDFGLQTAGSYQVIATDTTTGCTSVTSVVFINTIPVPNVYSVTGGGSFCDSGAGVDVAMTGSDGGIKYQLYVGSLASGAAWFGTTSAIDFGNETKGGIYKVVAIDTISGCTDTMSDSAIVIVNPLVDAGISITSAPSKHDTICEGNLVTLTAVPSNGGSAPVFSWTVNGSPVSGNDTDNYTYAPLSTTDVVVVTMLSNANCLVLPGLASDEVTVDVEPVFIPVVTISGATMISKGQNDTLKAIVTSAGAHPRYQWMRNGKPIAGATSATYGGTFNNNDTMTCVVFGTGHCSDAYPSFNGVIMHVSTTDVPNVATGMELVVMPNPSKGTFTISGTTGTINDGEVSLEVTNVVGQVVYQNKVTTHDGAIAQQVQLDNTITPGMYLLSVRSGSEQKVLRIVVEK